MKKIRIIQKIIKTIKNNGLINKGDRVLVALSGGADSVFLLYALHYIKENFGFEIGACHIEHGIRGESSVQDMVFSKNLCQELGIEFFCKSFDVPSVAKNEKLSVEAAGRKVRYEFFSHIMKENNYNILATAHHMDDKIETVVMNILRGCSLRGFAGIEYKNRNIIRPLLDIRKSEITRYLEDNGISFCTDETNSDVNYTRNRIRHILLPALKEFNPSVEDVFLRQSNIFTDEDAYLQEVSEKEYAQCVCDGRIDISKLIMRHKAIQRRIMYIYLSSVKGSSSNITAIDIEACLDICHRGLTGKRLNLSNGTEVCTDYGFLCISDGDETPYFEYKLQFNIPVEVEELGLRLTLLPQGGKLLINKNDAVYVRNRRPGDVFCPVGMTGSKKLKSFFSDLKISRSLRSRIPLVVINGEIASVLDIRDDRRFCDGGGTCRVVTEKI